MIERLLDRLFPHKEISGPGLNEKYLKRWNLWPWHEITDERPHDGRCVFLHRFTGDDFGRNLHDHPWDFWSIGLRGAYFEEYAPDSPFVAPLVRVFTAPWVRWCAAEHRHRLVLKTPCVWTLILTGPKRRSWGFWVNGIKARFVPWREYHAQIFDKADARQIPKGNHDGPSRYA